MGAMTSSARFAWLALGFLSLNMTALAAPLVPAKPLAPIPAPSPSSAVPALSPSAPPAIGGEQASAPFLETFPALQKYVYSERTSNVYFGFGVSPITLINNRLGFGLNIFQVHWMSQPWDIEWFSASFGTTLAQQSYTKSQNFLFRSVPKYLITKNISVGPMVGLEFVSFSNLNARLYKGSFYTPTRPFSALGAVYGADLCETFAVGKSNKIKLNQLIYKETYNHLGTNNGWRYAFDPSDLNLDASPIAPSMVFMLEISFLY